jgi:glycerol uptake facilitator-like aquaporin
MPIADRSEAVELAESSLEEPAKRIRSINRIAEFLGGCGFVLVVLGFADSANDLLIGLPLLLFSFAALVYSVRLFLAEYFGTAMYAARLRGKNPPSPNRIW